MEQRIPLWRVLRGRSPFRKTPISTNSPPGSRSADRHLRSRTGLPAGGSRGPGWLLAVALAVLILLGWLLPEGADGIIIPAPDTTRVTWSSSHADTTKVKATFLSEAEPTTGHNASADGIYVENPASSASQRVGLVMWAESIPDSVPPAFTRATLTLYRLNGTDAAAVYDTLEIAPVTVNWTEAPATWMNRAAGKLWSTSGGDVDASRAVLIRAETVPNLCSGPADSAVTFDITPIVVAWRDHAVNSFGVRLAWRDGVAPAIRSHDNAAPEALRPVLTIETVTIRRPVIRGAVLRWRGRFPGRGVGRG